MSARSAKKETLKAQRALSELIKKYRVGLPDQLRYPPPEFEGTQRHQEIVIAFMERVAMLLAPMDKERSEFSLREGSRNMVRSFEHLQNQLPQKLKNTNGGDPIPLACEVGCNHCCSLRVSVLAPEVLVLAHYLKKKLGADDLQALIKRMDDFEAGVAGLSPLEQAFRSVLCPLNVEGQCIGYANRPFTCTSYHSFDLSKCIERRENPRAESAVLQDPMRLTLRTLHKDATMAAMSALGLDATELEFVPALRVALSDSEAGAKYLKGEPVFASADMPAVREASASRFAM
ncbi:MAG TPA: hypothetical protein VK171_11810 [Fimbriimonas sp.]|nr:hypothetical protein [Fimbriimonas sp.]